MDWRASWAGPRTFGAEINTGAGAPTKGTLKYLVHGRRLKCGGGGDECIFGIDIKKEIVRAE